MYGNFRGGRSSEYRSSSEPPWALDYLDTGTPTTFSNNNRNNYNNSRNNYNNNNSRNNYNSNNRSSNNTNNNSRGGLFNNNYSSSSSTNPPWATSHTDGGAGGRYGGGRGNNYGNSGAGRRMMSETRYGPSTGERPYDRDLPYWHRLRPYNPPTGTDSHRDRERARREERVSEDRRNRRAVEERRNVPDEVPLKKNVLTIKDVDLHVRENTREHRTDGYDCTERDLDPRLVIRRGQVFIVTLTFQRPWSSKDDDLYVQFSLGENPSEADGSMIKFQMTETDSSRYREEQRWGARIAKQDNTRLTLYIYTAPNAIVGEWKCVVSSSLAETSELFVYYGIPEIYLLFNPWCKDDQVFYTENPQDLEEYVLNEYGCVFDGQADYISRKPWFYGQFQDGILDVCMTILRLAFEMQVTTDMGDAVEVARKLSRILNNSSRDPGILTGNWSNDYSRGTAPQTWRGSVQILKEYARTKQAVNYAQCWVFSHVFTTVCRALGLPSRSLTNYESAHDTDKTVTIDSFRDENGEDLPQYKYDSIWNFHCWNDVWINRPDLDGSAREGSARGRYSGWHAVDATPQERSQGRFQCGPTPHKAIKNGELSVGYDTNFIFGEVNGEVCTWMVPSKLLQRHANIKLISQDPNAFQEVKLISREPDIVGKTISTKVPDGQPARGIYNPGAREVHEKRMDITHLYKYPEGSQDEREALKLAVGRVLGSKMFETPGGVTVDIVKIPPTAVGNNFSFAVVVTNSSNDKRIIDLVLGVYPMDYRGMRLGFDTIAYNKREKLVLRPGSREKYDVQVAEKSYLALCDKAMAMMLRASVKINGEDKPISKQQKLVLHSPAISVEVPGGAGRISREQTFTVTVIVSNPCSKPLTGCKLQLSGSIQPNPEQGFKEVDGGHVRTMKDIFPLQMATFNIDVSAQKRPLNNRVRELDITLTNDVLPDLTGSLIINVNK